MNGRAFGEGIVPVDASAAVAARRRLDALTKPLRSLGRLEELAVQLCAISGEVVTKSYTAKAILVAAGDHGVAEEGVSAYPAEVTPQMVATFLRGKAAINALARISGADVYVANAGVRAQLAEHPALIDVCVGRGTRNLARENAMSARDVERSLAAGSAAVDAMFARRSYDVLALGEMGIGNTTSAAAIVAACTGAAADDVTGRGTGVDDAHYERKRRIVARAVEPLRDATWDAIAGAVGGFEIVVLTGAILAAARRRLPVVLDGFIVAAAALLAARIVPASIGYCIAAHRSQERGHAVALRALGLVPLMDLELRLGEGSGAALALPLVEAATRALVEMQTFAEAGVATAAL